MPIITGATGMQKWPGMGIKVGILKYKTGSGFMQKKFAHLQSYTNSPSVPGPLAYKKVKRKVENRVRWVQKLDWVCPAQKKKRAKPGVSYDISRNPNLVL